MSDLTCPTCARPTELRTAAGERVCWHCATQRSAPVHVPPPLPASVAPPAWLTERRSRCPHRVTRRDPWNRATHRYCESCTSVVKVRRPEEGHARR